MNRTPFPHQDEAVGRLRGSLLDGHRRIMLQAPTGFGKTLLAAMIVEGALARGKRVIFTVPLLSLIDQTVAAFEAEGIDAIGVMQGFHERSDWNQPVQVASIHTLRRRKIPPADLVLIDEAHVWFQFYEDWMNDPAWAGVPFIGLSATPWTKGLGKHYQDLVAVRTTADLIAQGFLSPFRVFAPSHPDLTGVRTLAGDYNEGDLAEAMDKQSLVADVVSTWLQRGENRPTLCFGVNRAHANHLQQQFTAAGVSTAYIDFKTKLDERRAILDRFAAGEVKVICNVATLTTGVDQDVRCVILARPTKSHMLYVQMVGRGLRTAPGKEDCLILDHSDTTLRLGFVTDLTQAWLDDGKGRGPVERKVDVPVPKECPSCKFLRPAKVSLCPACGFKPERQSNVQCDDGELVEVTAKAAKKRRLDLDEMRIVYGQFRHYAAARGYKPGWAAHQFREFTGQYPDGVENAPRQEPTPQILSWIKSRNIRFAMGRNRAA